MNKYEKAFSVLREHANADTVDALVDIKEFVEKATPKQLVYKRVTKQCSNCKRQIATTGTVKLNVKYCPKCGQAIEWN